jgi:hypothetical protein
VETSTVRFFDVWKITTPTALPLLISCKLSFPIFELKIYSVPTLALKSPNKISSYVISRIYQTHVFILRRSCPSHHHCYLLLEHERSEQWYDTSDLLVLCIYVPLTNWAFLTDSIMYKRILYPIHYSYSPFHRKMCSSAGSVPPPFHLTSCTSTRTNLYLDSSFDTVTSEPVLYKLPTFHVRSLMSILRRLCRLSKEYVQVHGSYLYFVRG